LLRDTAFYGLYKAMVGSVVEWCTKQTEGFEVLWNSFFAGSDFKIIILDQSCLTIVW